MIKGFFSLKNKIEVLGNTTKAALKITITLVITCLIFALACFIFKDYSSRYIFFSNLCLELLIVARSCAALGTVFVLIGKRIEK